MNKKKNIRQILRFSIVGFFNTFVDYSVFYILLSAMHFNKSVAQIFATAIAMSGSYLINRYWTFQKHGKGSIGEIIRFVIINIIAMLSVIITLHLFYDLWHIEQMANHILAAAGVSFVLSGNGAIMFCKLCSSVISFFVNFLGNKFWVFRKKSS